MFRTHPTSHVLILWTSSKIFTLSTTSRNHINTFIYISLGTINNTNPRKLQFICSSFQDLPTQRKLLKKKKKPSHKTWALKYPQERGKFKHLKLTYLSNLLRPFSLDIPTHLRLRRQKKKLDLLPKSEKNEDGGDGDTQTKEEGNAGKLPLEWLGVHE